jgi:hypothetical protein
VLAIPFRSLFMNFNDLPMLHATLRYLGVMLHTEPVVMKGVSTSPETLLYVTPAVKIPQRHGWDVANQEHWQVIADA